MYSLPIWNTGEPGLAKPPQQTRHIKKMLAPTLAQNLADIVSICCVLLGLYTI